MLYTAQKRSEISAVVIFVTLRVRRWCAHMTRPMLVPRWLNGWGARGWLKHRFLVRINRRGGKPAAPASTKRSPNQSSNQCEQDCQHQNDKDVRDKRGHYGLGSDQIGVCTLRLCSIFK